MRHLLAMAVMGLMMTEMPVYENFYFKGLPSKRTYKKRKKMKRKLGFRK